MTDIHIPPEAEEAAKRCVCLNGCGPNVQCDYCTKTAIAALRAGLRAWPGMHEAASQRLGTQIIILPMPQENADE